MVHKPYRDTCHPSKHPLDQIETGVSRFEVVEFHCELLH